LTSSYNTISSQQYRYKFTYDLGKVDIAEAYIAGGQSPDYKLVRTYKLNKDGFPLEEILSDGRVLTRYILLEFTIKLQR
jgi:hypothetical protein